MPDNNDLEDRLKAARAEYKKDYPDETDASVNESLSDGARAGIELVGGVLGGGLIGFGLDKLFDSSLICFFLFLIFGVLTGFYNVYKITSGSGTAVGFMRLHQTKKTAKQDAILTKDNEPTKRG